MKYTFIVIAVLFTFSICPSANASVENSTSPKHLADSTNSSDTLYSQFIESFLIEMQEKYGENYEDSLWIHLHDLKSRLIGVKFDNFAFKDVRKKNIDLYEDGKPIIVEVSASWCAPCIAMEPVINDLSVKYEEELRFIILTHDSGKRAKKYASKYKKGISVVPSHEILDIKKSIKLRAGNFKHLFSFPTAYFIDADGIIVSIRTGGMMAGPYPKEDEMIILSEEDAYNGNLKILMSGIDILMK